MPRRRRGAGEPGLPPRGLPWPMPPKGLNRSFARRLGNRQQAPGGPAPRHGPAPAPAHAREGASHPEHPVAHLRGGRDALACRGAIEPRGRGMHRGPRRDEASGGPRRVAGRPFLHLDGVGGRAPTALGLRPQCRVPVVLAQITREKRRAVFTRRADKGLLRPLRDPPPDPAAARSPPGDRPAPPPRGSGIRGGQERSQRPSWTHGFRPLPGINVPASRIEASTLPQQAGAAFQDGVRALLVPSGAAPPGEKPHA